ncbi:hypothetical protein R2Q81_10130 [Microbacterium aquimaris]|uniref:hypothetical protein n=1 Tax=Microbacterium aquimaris TaxID=459816 RepID=UPI002AD56978|nr:hypothetical protein [Microbacterium aquimaris]MDZ8276303.1 hypothetical protein [Microbacterium aquimaris]
MTFVVVTAAEVTARELFDISLDIDAQASEMQQSDESDRRDNASRRRSNASDSREHRAAEGGVAALPARIR